jgi:hypothetical protein
MFMGAVNPPATKRSPTGEAGDTSFVSDGYVVNVAAFGESWFVKSGVATEVGVGEPVPVVPVHPAITLIVMIRTRRIKLYFSPLFIMGVIRSIIY